MSKTLFIITPATVTLILSLCFATVMAQQPGNRQHDLQHDHPNHVTALGYDQLAADVENGVISSRDALIEQLRLTLDPSTASPLYQDDSGFIRCLMPVINEFETYRGELDQNVVQEMDVLLIASRDHSHVYISESGRFSLHYSTSGNHAVPVIDTNMNGVPDYIEQAAVYADSSWNYMVNTLGFSEFVPVDQTYSIYFEDIRAYGYTQPVANGGTEIIVHSTFDGFPGNHDPEGQQLGALKVTIAHEMKHAAQYAASRWKGGTGNMSWLEMDATMMENVLFGTVKDYYNYLGSQSVFLAPERSTPLAYAHATWMLFYTEHLGIDFWVDTWSRIGNGSTDMLASISDELQSRSLTFNEMNTRNLLWHLAAGEYAPHDYGFDEKSDYPTPLLIRNNSDAVISSGFDRSLNKLSANFFMIDPPVDRNGHVQIRLESNGGAAGLGVLAYMNNGDVMEFLATDDGSGIITIQTGQAWSDLSRIGVAVVNSHRDDGMNYAFEVETIDLPVAAELEQNYPNPFNPSTTIRFTMPSRSNATLTVYDVLGRQVAILFENTEFGAGTQHVDFNASNLSSGVYLYRLITDSGVQTRKMTLIK